MPFFVDVGFRKGDVGGERGCDATVGFLTDGRPLDADGEARK